MRESHAVSTSRGKTALVRVAIRATYTPRVSGGVEQYVEGLAAGLSALEQGDRFDFIGTEAHRAHLSPYIHEPSSFVLVRSPLRSSDGVQRVLRSRPGRAVLRVDATHDGSSAGPAPRALRGSSRREGTTSFTTPHRSARPRNCRPSTSRGTSSTFTSRSTSHPICLRFVTRSGAPVRNARRTCSSRPSSSETMSSTPSRLTRVASQWCPQGAHLPPGHRSRGRVPGVEEPFALYPAQAWEHKNHFRLLEAVALLEQRGLSVRLVCPGQPNERLRAVDVAPLSWGSSRWCGSRVMSPMASSRRCTGRLGASCPRHCSRGLVSRCSRRSSPACPSPARRPLPWASWPVAPRHVRSHRRRSHRRGAQQGLVGRRDGAALVEAGHARAEGYSRDRLAAACRALYRAAAGDTVNAADAALLAAAGVGVGSGD